MDVRRSVKQAYSVAQVNKYVKNMFENDYLLRRISVKGEVSNCKYHPSGHIYFSLKDAGGTLSCIMFAGARKGLAFRMQDGQQVIVTGSVEVYEAGGKYQLYARTIEQDGIGSLYEQYERLKNELAEMGMFDAQYKKEIPRYAQKIGIVTASTGAAIRDIENISRRRNPYVQLILCPALVQGDGAAESICQGIRRLEQEKVDVIIVGRGGGSIEDLWAFNERVVAETVFSCSVPIISAVGHETDTTICDWVADKRVPTPSAAAELAVWEYRAFEEVLRHNRMLLDNHMEHILTSYRFRKELLERKLLHQGPESRLHEMQHRQAVLADKLEELMKRRVSAAEKQFLLYSERLSGLSPLKKLQSGYSFTQDSNGKALTSISQTKPGDDIRIHVTDGSLLCTVKETIRKED